MLKERTALVRKVADLLFAAEDSTDLTAQTLNNLMNAITSGRHDIRMAAEVGHDALVHLAQAQAAAIALRGHLIAAHRQLADDQVRIGAREVATGGWINKPPMNRAGTAPVEAMDRTHA